MKSSILKNPFTVCLLVAVVLSSHLRAQVIQTYSYTGAVQSFTVPSCVSTITVDARGSMGGDYNATIGKGGLGGRVQCVYTVSAGQVLNIFVGNVSYNGGGTSLAGSPARVNDGGGASDIRLNGITLSDRIIIAGGAGGGGNNCGGTNTERGGNGGGLIGEDGWQCSLQTGATGKGATQSAGGLPTSNPTSPGTPGQLGIGGNGGGVNGGGGGGGYYGGGGASFGGGGGGSSYTGPGATSVVHTQGFQNGAGAITFSYNFNGAGVQSSASSNSICIGTTATLTAANVLSYTWSPGGSNAPTLTVSPTSTSVYTVQGTNSLGCISTGIITVTVDVAAPTLTVTNTANTGGICPTKTVVLTATGARGYTWTGGSVPVTNGIAFAPPIAASYTITGVNACGSSSAVTSVSVHPLPTVVAVASSASLCSGSTLTLNTTGSNASTYTWTSGQTSGVGFAPALTATYTVIGTSALSCTASAAVPVTVVATPINAPTSSTLINCIGNSVTLTATGATNYTWTSATQTVFTPTLAATPSATGISTYTVIKANGSCTDTKLISITTNSLPTVFAIANPTIVCALSPATLAVGGGISYTWTAANTPSFTGASPVVYPLVSTNYSVAASDGTCISRTTVSLSANPVPTIALASATAICDGQSVIVNATGGINYTWTSTSGGTFQNTLTITDTPTTTVAYNITGDNSFGCTSVASQVVLVNPNPTLTISASRTLVCSNANATLTANGANNYTWTSNGALTNTIVVNPVSLISAPVIYTAVGSYTTGCIGSKTLAVNVYVPVLTVSGNTNACIGGMVSLAAGGGNNGSYTWNTGTSTSNFQTLTTTLSAASVFTLSASSTSITTNCPATKTVAVGIYSNPIITAVAERTTICMGESVKLYGLGGLNYVWNNSMTGGTITVTPLTQTNYTVTGTDGNGCMSTGTVQVKVSSCHFTGVDQQTNATTDLLIYPNPGNGEFTIQSSTKVNLTLVNELGQVIKTYDLSGENEYKASVKDLAKGIYFITGQNINRKVIVMK